MRLLVSMQEGCRIWKHALFIFCHFHIRFVEFYFGFEDSRIFALPHRLAASHLLYWILICLVWRKLRKRNLARIHVFNQIHAAPNFFGFQVYVAITYYKLLHQATRAEGKNSSRESRDILVSERDLCDTQQLEGVDITLL